MSVSEISNKLMRIAIKTKITFRQLYLNNYFCLVNKYENLKTCTMIVNEFLIKLVCCDKINNCKIQYL